MTQAQLFPGGKRPKVNVGERTYAFQCKTLRLPTVTEQYLFAKPLGRRFTADFAFVEYQLLVEIQGGIWMGGGGAHSRPQSIQRDVEKQQLAVLLGYYLLPVTPAEVKNGYAVDLTQRVLFKLGWRPNS